MKAVHRFICTGTDSPKIIIVCKQRSESMEMFRTRTD